jgi:hypothetical protein
MREGEADDVSEEEVPLESPAAEAPPRETVPGGEGSAAAAAGAGAPALCVLPAPTLPFGCEGRCGKSWSESVFCEGTVTTGDTSPLPAALGVTPWAPDAIPAPVALLSGAVVDATFAGFGGIPTT